MTPQKVTQIPAIMLAIHTELHKSYAKHGNWQGQDIESIISIIRKELGEAHDAMIKLDRNGPHGYFVELCQVAACCIKAIVELGDDVNVDNSMDKMLITRPECAINSTQNNN